MLIGEKILLRPLLKEDKTRTYLWRNDPFIKKATMMHPFPITESVEEEWFNSIMASKKNDVIYFGIVEKAGNELIGYVLLNKINYISGTCGLGLVIGNSASRGKRLGKDVLELITRYAFEVLNLRKITLEVSEGNKQAIRLYEGFGFVQEGRLKEHFFSEGSLEDVIVMSFFR